MKKENMKNGKEKMPLPFYIEIAHMGKMYFESKDEFERYKIFFRPIIREWNLKHATIREEKFIDDINCSSTSFIT